MGKGIKEWKVESIKVDDVILMPDNERFIDQENFEGLRQSIKRFGLVELPIWNFITKHLIGGHQRFKALKEMGAENIEVIVVELSEEEELAANLTMNNPAIQGTWTENTSELLHSIEASDKELYKSLNMDVLQKEVDKLLPKIPQIEPLPLQLPNPEFDTTCPCCGHKWLIQAKDISIETVDSGRIPAKTEDLGEQEIESDKQ